MFIDRIGRMLLIDGADQRNGEQKPENMKDMCPDYDQIVGPGEQQKKITKQQYSENIMFIKRSIAKNTIEKQERYSTIIDQRGENRVNHIMRKNQYRDINHGKLFLFIKKVHRKNITCNLNQKKELIHC